MLEFVSSINYLMESIMIEERHKKQPETWTADDRTRAIIDTETTNTCSNCKNNRGYYGCTAWSCDVESSETCYMHTAEDDNVSK